MSASTDSEPCFAILIDADNVSEKYIKIVLDEVANFGVATYKRIYGDWTSPRLGSWKTCLLDNSITPIQQYSYTYGKNATDSAMIIDAMDILYSGKVDGFAIVSSDSDFTRLVARLREGGMQVVGMGEQKTPKPFISACNQFKYLDLLWAAQRQQEREEDAADAAEEAAEAEERKASRRRRGRGRGKRDAAPESQEGAAEAAEGAEQVSAEAADGPAAPRPQRRHPGDAGGAVALEPPVSVEEADRPDAAFDAPATDVEFAEMSKAARRQHMKKIRSAINAVIDKFSDDDGWVSLGRLGDELSKRLPDFDVRNYGFKKLRPFLKSLGVYEFDEPDGASGQRQIYLRVKEG